MKVELSKELARGWGMTKVKEISIIITCLILSLKFGTDVKDYVRWRIFPSKSGSIVYPFQNSTSSTGTTTETLAKPKRWSTPPPELEPPNDHPPLSIIVGAYSYTVHYTTNEWLRLNDCGAVTMHDSHTIWLARSDLDPRQDLMHELFHISKQAAADQHWNFSEEEHDTPETMDHAFIRPAAPEFLLILRRNPKLVAWLTDLNHSSVGE